MDSQQTFTRRQALALGIGAGLSSLWLSGPLGRRAWAKEVTLKAAYNTFASLVQYFAAKEQGLFQGEGIKLEDAFTPPHLTMPGLASSQFDFAFHNMLDIVQINVKGVSIKVVYPGAILSEKYPYSQLVVPTGSSIRTAKDLEGRKIAVSLVRSSIELILLSWLTANGVDPEKVSLVQVGIDGIIPAVKSRQFDAVYAIEPALTVIKGQKLGEAIAFPQVTLGSQVLVTGYIAREAWIEKNPDTVQAIVRVLDKATQWLMAHPQEIPGIIARNAKIEESLARQMIPPGLTRVARKGDLQPFFDAATKFKFIPQRVDACTLLSKYCPQEC